MNFKIYDGPLLEKINKNYSISYNFMEVGEEKAIFFPSFRKWFDRYKAFDSRPDDVWVLSFPKAGTTWTQEMVWCILNDVDSEKSKEVLMKRFPFFEWDGLLPEDLSLLPKLEEGNPCNPEETWKLLHKNESPRTIKSHLHMFLLPDSVFSVKPKIVYVCRDPRDVCVSYYFHNVKLDGFTGTFDDFFELFINDAIYYMPFWKHILDFWEIRHQENILFIRYEELQQDLKGMIIKVSKFLGKDLSEGYIEKLVDHLSFSSMKKNRAVNNELILSLETEQSKQLAFMRKGKVGDWKAHMNKDQIEAFRKWTEEKLGGSDFPYYRDYE